MTAKTHPPPKTFRDPEAMLMGSPFTSPVSAVGAAPLGRRPYTPQEQIPSAGLQLPRGCRHPGWM
jgi:hypothetical protein